ncbi:MAG: hypothetical protein CMG60_09150 [Candidatus Marinimicrobia bacterium]|nr:hypothetical protein [Candidatus Neomarinimicrobiota bacterium]|tara:strand:+ start:1356 stop:1847 length:492 start_codon:yes stop_codon:yes gene_type:complete
MYLKRIIPYLTILASALIIIIGLKNNYFSNLFSSESSKTIELNKLYLKNQYNNSEFEKSKVAIKNGCGKKQLGLTYKRYLLDVGYDITETSNAEHFGHTYTKILFHKNNKASAKYLSTELGINDNKIIEDTNDDIFQDLTLILGQNYANLKSHKTAVKYNPFK